VYRRLLDVALRYPFHVPLLIANWSFVKDTLPVFEMKPLYYGSDVERAKLTTGHRTIEHNGTASDITHILVCP
jgi:hypothetical protein